MDDDLQIVISNPLLRRKYFEYDFEMFYAYYSKNKVSDFQVNWLETLSSKKNVLLFGFR